MQSIISIFGPESIISINVLPYIFVFVYLGIFLFGTHTINCYRHLLIDSQTKMIFFAARIQEKTNRSELIYISTRQMELFYIYILYKLLTSRAMSAHYNMVQ